jgi:hypothetical protein
MQLSSPLLISDLVPHLGGGGWNHAAKLQIAVADFNSIGTFIWNGENNYVLGHVTQQN